MKIADTLLIALLSDPSPVFRLLVLKELLGKADDDREVRELTALVDGDPLIRDLVDVKRPLDNRNVRRTMIELRRLGYLDFPPEDPRVTDRAEALFELQDDDGSWPIGRFSAGERADESGYSMIPQQTALPLYALASAGYADDPRCERAYEWLLSKRLDDGAWPAGISGGVFGRIAGYRRLPHSRWGCRSNTTGALCALAFHPDRRRGPAARRALDLILGRSSCEESPLGFELARILGLEKAGGTFTYFARFDLAHILELCGRVGADSSDVRIEKIVDFLSDRAKESGLLEHTTHPVLNRWLTFDVLRSMASVSVSEAWFSEEPETPFRSYSAPKRRY